MAAPESVVDEIEAERLASIRSRIAADLEAGADAIQAAQAPNHVVHGIMPVAGGSLAASGGTGKTTLALNEAVQIVNGGQLYGHDVILQGPCVMVMAEDGASYGRYLLQQVLADGVQAGRLSDRTVDNARHGIKFVGWSRSDFGPIATATNYGEISRAPIFDALMDLLTPIKPVFISLDPSSLFGPGERYGNDGDAFLASMIHAAALELGCFIQLVDHVSQNVARSGIIDQHAARGGTAKTDNARLARQLVKFKGDDGERALPDSITPEDIEKGRILQLHWTKSNYAPLPPMVWLRRRRFWMETLRGPSIEDAAEMRVAKVSRQQASDVLAVVDAVRAIRAKDGRWTKGDLEGSQVLDTAGDKLPRARVRTAIGQALLDGQLVLADLPASERHGARRQYLEIGSGLL